MLKRFGEKLHLLRVSHGMTLSELASATGLRTHSYISELEAGKKIPTVNFVITIAKFFAVTTDYLLIDEIDSINITKTYEEK
ncbi:MAG: helix-turn-helix transcriptional regulator [Methylovulum sp.]|nr:helix-turn-helix transcriptional regulator [Methylovulum sp.]